MSLISLLPELDPNAIVAYYRGRAIKRGVFLGHVLALAETLRSRGNVLNMCGDRYAFAVALFAAIAKENITVLPNSAAPDHLAVVAEEHDNLLVLGDETSTRALNLPFVSIENYLSDDTMATAPMPLIAFDQTIVCVYTSGSTGNPTAHRKTFGRVRLNILAGAERLWQVARGACSVIGTTPIRHMYGLESSVLLPILGGGCMSAEIPFFPADVARSLEQLPSPRLLVTTPFHLRKLVEADLPLPKISAILSATAPLSSELARQAEQQFDCVVIEIYGSTETGQLATRLPCESDTWETLAGVELKIDGDEAWAHGEVHETPQLINDIIELVSNEVGEGNGSSRFRLVDRKSNIINVAGKRSSLSCLNAAITKLPGVVDAVFFVPKREGGPDIERLAAFIVAPGLGRAEVFAGLRAQVDPVFLPRPLIFIDALPRDGNGKIPAAKMQALIAQHMSASV